MLTLNNSFLSGFFFYYSHKYTVRWLYIYIYTRYTAQSVILIIRLNVFIYTSRLNLRVSGAGRDRVEPGTRLGNGLYYTTTGRGGGGERERHREWQNDGGAHFARLTVVVGSSHACAQRPT